jgi:serine/threonine protein kinase
MGLEIEKMEAGQVIKFSKPKYYEFVKALKAGGTGKTLLMRDSTINELFVCKKYDPEQKEYEDEFYNRFVEEIKIMYSVYHNNIVRIYDYFLYPEYKTGYIIMEYIKGENIEEYFRLADGEDINSIFVQIINAFLYLEQHNILHRDIRATNIMIDEKGDIKVIDFGFGKKLIEEQQENQASVLLNWPASKVPDEIYSEQYGIQTEIFYVGYLIKNIIEKYNIKCFKYGILLEKMIQVNPVNRMHSFEEIQNSIAEQTFEQINFTDEEKEIYQKFANSICALLYQIKDSLSIEKDSSIIIEKLRVILRDNSLEEYITNVTTLISIFVKSDYRYYNNRVEVYKVKDFYEFFLNQADAVKEIILNNLYGRIGNIPVIDSAFDEELPFN